MKILIVASTTLEVKNLMELKPAVADFLICGVGTPACMYELSKTFNQANHYDLIINVGIAGSFDTKLDIGTVVRVSQDQFGDVGIGHQNKYLPIGKTDFSCPHYDKLHNDFCPEPLKHLKAVRGITVNTVSYSKALSDKRKTWYQADIETMEGAGFFLSLKTLKTPYLQIRAISNYTGESDKSKWNIPLAIDRLQSEIIQYLKTL